MTVEMSELSTYSEMFHAPPHLQAAELAEYSVKITLLEEAKRSKEEEAESWHSKVMKHLLPKDVEVPQGLSPHGDLLVEFTPSLHARLQKWRRIW